MFDSDSDAMKPAGNNDQCQMPKDQKIQSDACVIGHWTLVIQENVTDLEKPG
jgi:hypothetical protein